jgi:hypothetical protein
MKITDTQKAMSMLALIALFAALASCGCVHIDRALAKLPEIGKPSDPSAPAAMQDEIDLSTVAWDGLDIRGWSITHDLAASVSGSAVRLAQNGTRVWPDVGKRASDGRVITGNAWVVAQISGQWRAATWEWMTQGQQSKNTKAVAGDHVKKSTWPSSWRPSRGETIYFAVSGLCRDNHRNASERTPFKKVIWP